MNIQELCQSMMNQLGAKTVYGEPITAEGRTVVPVARIACGFGGGSGRTPDRPEDHAGGGGGFVAKPVAVVEITREGTRFIPLGESRKLAVAAGLGFCLGLLLARKRINVRVEKRNAGTKA